MERLTKRRGDTGEPCICTIEGVNNAVARLAAYEDTGLEPEEITVQLEILRKYSEAADGIGLKRLRELSQAEKDGRLVIVGRCKDCAHWVPPHIEKNGKFVRGLKKGEIVPLSEGINVSSYCSMVDAVFVHGFREGETSSDKTKAWMEEDEFCSKFERRRPTMAEYVLKPAALDALQSEGITRNMRAYKMLQAIKAADVAPVRHGRWIMRGGRFHCSLCDAKAKWDCDGCTGGWSREYTQAESEYCPNCGAKMDGEVGENGRM